MAILTVINTKTKTVSKEKGEKRLWVGKVLENQSKYNYLHTGAAGL